MESRHEQQGFRLYTTTTTSRRTSTRTTAVAVPQTDRGPLPTRDTGFNAIPFSSVVQTNKKKDEEAPNYKKTDQKEPNHIQNDAEKTKTKKNEQYRKTVSCASWLLGVGIMVVVMLLGGFQPHGRISKQGQPDQQGSLATLNQNVPFGARRQAELPTPLQALLHQDTTSATTSHLSSSSTNRSKLKDDDTSTTGTGGGSFRSDYNLVHVLHTELWSHSPSSKTTRQRQQDSSYSSSAFSHALDRARLDLLQTFTIPSLMQQDNQQYLWMIWIVGSNSPANPELWQELFQSLQAVPHAIVVQVSSSSNSPGRLPYKQETIRTAYAGGEQWHLQEQHHQSVWPQRPTWTIWRPSTLTHLESIFLAPKQKDDWAWNPLEPPTTGEMWGDNESSSLVHQANHVEAWSLFLDYVQASQTRVALDTWLEADDALSFDFVETVQAEVAHTYQDSHKDSDAAKQEQDENGDKDKEENDPVPSSSSSSSSGMQVYCPEFHAEWRYFGASSPPPSHGRRRNQPNVGEAATDSPETNDRNNNKKGHSEYNDNNELGQLVHVHNRRFCIASGLTVAHPLPPPSSPSSLEDDGPDEEQTRGSSKRQRRRLQQRRPRHLSPCNEAQHHDDCQDRDRSSSTIGHVLTMYRGKGKGGKGKGGSKKYCDDKNETEKSSKQSKSKSKASTKPNKAKSQKGEDHKSSSLSSLEATKKKKLSLLRASPALFRPQEVQSQSPEDELLSSSTDLFETSSSSASFLWNLFDVSDSKKKKNKKNKKPKQPKDRQLLLAGYHNVTRSIKHKTTNKSSSSKMSKQEPSSCKNKKKEKLSWIPTGTATLMTNRSGPLYYNAANYSATCPRGSYYCRGASSSFHDEDDDPDTWFADKELINHQDLMHATNSSNSSNPGPCTVSVVCRPARVDTDGCQSKEEDDHVLWFNLHLVHPLGTHVFDFDVEYVGSQAFADFVAYMKRQMNGDSCPLRDDDDDKEVQKKTKTKDKVDAYTVTLAYVRSLADQAAPNIPQYAYYEFPVVSSPNKTDKDDQPPRKKKEEESVSLGGAPRIQRFTANGLIELALCVAPVPIPPKKKNKKDDHCVQRLRRLPELESRPSLGSSAVSSTPESTKGDGNWFGGWNTKQTNNKETKKDSDHGPPPHDDSTTGWLSTVQYRPMQASVLLARTPTAAGMKHVLPPPNNNKTAKTTTNSEIWWSTYGDVPSPAQAAAWQHVTETFGVDPERVRALRRRMQHNLRAIVLDNLYRQCAPGHSCKRSTQKALERLLEQHALQEEQQEPKHHDKVVDAGTNQKELSNQDDSVVAERTGILGVLSSLFLFG